MTHEAGAPKQLQIFGVTILATCCRCSEVIHIASPYVKGQHPIASIGARLLANIREATIEHLKIGCHAKVRAADR